MVVHKNSAEMLYVEPDCEELPQVTHFGRAHFSEARPPLHPHTHNSAMEFVYLVRGCITYEVNKASYRLNGGDIFITFPHEVHGTGQVPQERGTLYWIGIDMEGTGQGFLGCRDIQMTHFLTALRNIKNRHFRGEPVLQNIFDRFIEAMLSTLLYNRIIARSALIEFLAQILRFENRTGVANISSPILHCVAFIEKHIEEQLQLVQLAAVAHLSLPCFKQRFRKEMGIAPYDFILRRKIDRAKELLNEPARNITDVAFQLGFSSSQHFATIFKKITSQTPTQFKKNHCK